MAPKLTELSLINLSKIVLYLLFLGLTPLISMAQTKDKVKFSAESLTPGKGKSEPYKILTKNVVFSQKHTIINCDSAHYYDERNYLEAFGRVRIKEGDSITITGKKLTYDGNIKLAQIREDVVYRDPSMTLRTDFLDYDMVEQLAYYYDGGDLVTEANRITSNKGYYDTEARFASFKDSVILKNPDYTVEADTFQFNTISEVATFQGPTLITSRNGTILHAEDGGRYDTRQEISNFSGAEIETPKYLLDGDSLYGNELKSYYEANFNVRFTSKEEDVIITGEHGRYWKDLGLVKIYGKAVMRKILNEDTLYVSADTLISIEDSVLTNERLLAYHKVKIFKSDLQGRADSLSYELNDSVIYLYHDPILWQLQNQMVADTIDIELAEGQMDLMHMNSNAFVTSEAVPTYYNQIKGRKMIADFVESEINKVDVNGNGESIYYELEGDTLVMAMNKVICSDMLIKFKERQIVEITFYAPDGSFVPPHEMGGQTTKLKGFAWREEEKPSKAEVLHRSEPEENP